MSDSEEDDSSLNEFKTVVSGGVLVFGAKVIGVFCGFLTTIVLARLLTPDSYGKVVLVIAIINLVQLGSKLGISSGTIRKVPEYENEQSKFRGVVRASVRLGLIAGIVGAVAVFISAPTLATEVFGDSSLRVLLQIAAISIPFVVVGKIVISIARGMRDARPHAYINQIFEPLSRLLFIFILVIAGFQTIGAIIGHISASIAAGILGIFVMYRLLPSWETPPERMDREVLLYSIPLLAVNGMSFVLANTDTFMLGYFLTSDRIGIYNVSFQLRNSMNIIFMTIGFILPPQLTRLEKEDKRGKMDELYKLISKWILLLVLPLFVLFFFFPEFIIEFLFGQKYVGGSNVLRALALGALFESATGVTRSALIALNKNKIVMFTTGLGSIVNIILNIVLIPEYGILGAALASTVSFAVLEGGNVLILHDKFSILPFSTSMIIPASLGVISAIVCSSIIEGSILTIPIGLLVWLMIYPVIAGFGIQKSDEELYSQFKSEVTARVSNMWNH